MRNFRENLRNKANYGIKNILFCFGSFYLPWKDWCLSFSWIPEADARTAPSPGGLPSACSHERKKKDDNQSINILFSNMVEVTGHFVGQPPADNLFETDIFAGLWSERIWGKIKLPLSLIAYLCRTGRKNWEGTVILSKIWTGKRISSIRYLYWTVR